MDLMSILGWLAGIMVLVFGIVVDGNTYEVLLENFANFIDIPSLIIVFGGVISALMVSFPLNCFTKIPKHLKIMFFP